MSYNASPGPTSGNGAFGLVPGQTAVPPSLWEQLNQNVPNYGNLTSTATGDIQSLLNGTLSPQTMSNIGNYAASRGVASGQPNSAFSNEIGMSVTGNTSEGLMQQGIGDYNTFTNTAGGLQQSPALMAEISQSNANLAAAPSPSAAAAYALQLYNQYQNPAGGTGFSTNYGGGGGGGFSSGFGSDAQLASNFQNFTSQDQYSSGIGTPFDTGYGGYGGTVGYEGY